MPWLYEKIAGFAGLINRVDPRDIKLRDPRGLSKAQNISLDVGGKIRTIGGLADFTKVDGATALTQTAKLCPGSGLFPYGSDHWRGTDTVVDLLSDGDCTSDQQTEADDVSDWTDASAPGAALDSVTPAAAGIAASPASSVYILEISGGGAINDVRRGAATTVIGQRYKAHAYLYNETASAGSGIFLKIGTSAGASDLGASTITTTDDTWEEKEVEFVATSTSTHLTIYEHDRPGAGDIFADDVYITAIARSDVDTNWLALADVANAQVDLYNINDDSFTAALLDFGTASSFIGAAAGNVDFPTVSTITDSASTFLSQGVQAGDVRIVSGCSTTAANNIIFVVDRVIAGTVYARGSPFTVTAAEAGTVTLTKYNPVAFHYVNEALRASPIGGGIVLRPKHYSFIDRTHFSGAVSSERKFSDWYLNDAGPVAPTDIAAEADAGDQDASDLTAGAGWEVGISTTADDGEWTKGTYIIACSFIYDDGQESALYIPSTDEEFGTAIVDGDSLTITVRGKNDYDERISGGRVYCRIDESDDPWSLLVDISITKGARATLSGTYNAWNESDPTGSGAANVAYTAAFKSKRQNLDSYESLAGIDPTTTIETFSGDNAFWNASVIAGNRCFIFAPRYTDAGGNLQQFRDRIMYSQVNAYDTFPIDNIIDVVHGDAEDYVMGGIYGNDLLCFKSRTLYIVDISDPDPAGWQMKQDANKGKYPRRGVAHPGAYFETPHGPAWCNEFGVFLYNGSEIVPLLGDKIELSEYPLAYQRYFDFGISTDAFKVTVSDNAAIDFAAGAFSVEAIAKIGAFVNNGSTYNGLLSKGLIATGPAAFFALGMTSTNLLQFIVGEGSTIADSDSAINDGYWHHILGTRSAGGTLTLYIDGVAQATTGTQTQDVDNATDFEIGFDGNALRYIDADVSLVRLWASDVSASAVALAAGAPASSVGTPALELLPKSIGDATWTDTGANSLDGTVVGATAIYEDSWKKFYTDYSMLGYHAKTNSLIIMRDCTGKWSSGQDYGDAWLIDLDTLASTTGRRIFTKGIAYSNWTTDWNQDLIIAEQTSSTSVTIKKWTDEPQSQAAGLIDIRTADIDFGNPMFAKIFDALAAYYKSSAAQTTPFSYALDGDDRQTAWTRITGNFTAEEFWEKLTLEPTAFECDTIRFKLDNPTAAGTLELNDLVLRYSEEQEDID